MTALEKLMEDFKQLDEVAQTEVINFVEFMKQKHQKKLSVMADEIFNQYDEVFKELAK